MLAGPHTCVWSFPFPAAPCFPSTIPAHTQPGPSQPPACVPCNNRRLSLHDAFLVCSPIVPKQSMWNSVSLILPAHHEVEVVGAGLHAQVLAHELGVLEELVVHCCPGLCTVTPCCDSAVVQCDVPKQ